GLGGKRPKARKQDKACHLFPISFAIISSTPFSLQELAIHLTDGSPHLCRSPSSTQATPTMARMGPYVRALEATTRWGASSTQSFWAWRTWPETRTVVIASGVIGTWQACG